MFHYAYVKGDVPEWQYKSPALRAPMIGHFPIRYQVRRHEDGKPDAMVLDGLQGLDAAGVAAHRLNLEPWWKNRNV